MAKPPKVKVKAPPLSALSQATPIADSNIMKGQGWAGSKTPDVEKLAKNADKFLYHSDVSKNVDQLHYGIEPQQGGPWVREIAEHASDDPERLLNESTALSWFSDKPTWVKMKVARELNKPLSELTEEDIIKNGHLAIVNKKDPFLKDIWRVGEEGLSEGSHSKVQTLQGENIPAWHTNLYDNDYTGNKEPFGVESNEWVSTQPVEPFVQLTGIPLVDFLKKTGNYADGGMVDSVPEEAIKNTVRDPQAARLLDLDLAKYALMNQQPQRMMGGGAMKKIVKPAVKAVMPDANINQPSLFKPTKSGDVVGGYMVRDEIPNTSSIGSSLENYKTHGLQEVPMSAFGMEGKPQYYSKSTRDYTLNLADQINQNKELNPLIVVKDKEGYYVLEGGHRFDALRELDAQSFPALVVEDLDGMARGGAVRMAQGGQVMSEAIGGQVQTPIQGDMGKMTFDQYRASIGMHEGGRHMAGGGQVNVESGIDINRQYNPFSVLEKPTYGSDVPSTTPSIDQQRYELTMKGQQEERNRRYRAQQGDALAGVDPIGTLAVSDAARTLGLGTVALPVHAGRVGLHYLQHGNTKDAPTGKDYEELMSPRTAEGAELLEEVGTIGSRLTGSEMGFGMHPNLWAHTPPTTAQMRAGLKLHGEKVAPVIKDIGAMANERYLTGQMPGMVAPTSPLITWHGTPHNIEGNKFSNEKIGTGEGAQAFGYGHYLAEAKKTGEKYAEDLANRDANNQNRLTAHANAQRLVKLNGEPEYAADDIKFVLESNPDHPQKQLLSDTLKFIESGEYKNPLENKGNLYKIDLPDPIVEKMLDWDKPISEQHPAIQDVANQAMLRSENRILEMATQAKDALLKISESPKLADWAKKDLIDLSKTIDRIPTISGLDHVYKEVGMIADNLGDLVGHDAYEPFAKIAPKIKDLIFNNVKGINTGRDLYTVLKNTEGGQEKASNYLNSLGVSGIKYFDGNSRADAEGTRNFVVFDPKDAKFLEKNGVAIEQPKVVEPKEVKATSKIPEGEELIAHHNLSPAKLFGADALGGMPVPSLAISKASEPMTNFGEITLIAPSSLAEPSAKNPVFRSDAYTATKPNTTFSIDNKSESNLKNLLSNTIKNIPDGDHEFYRVVDDIKELEYNPLIRSKFLEEKGVLPNKDDFAHKYDFRRAVDEIINENKNEYESWLDNFQASLPDNGVDIKERIFKGYTNMGNRRYVDANLENFVKEMKGINNRQSFFGSPAYLRAVATPKFKNFKEVKSERSRIVSAEDFEKSKKETDEKFEDLNKKLREISGYDSRDALAEVAETRNPNVLDRIYGEGNVSSDLKKEISSFVNELKSLPTGYFEAKPQRAVGLNEFAGAIIPKDSTDKVRAILKKNGITDIHEYSTPEERLSLFKKYGKHMFTAAPVAVGAGLNEVAESQEDPNNMKRGGKVSFAKSADEMRKELLRNKHG